MAHDILFCLDVAVHQLSQTNPRDVSTFFSYLLPLRFDVTSRLSVGRFRPGSSDNNIYMNTMSEYFGNRCNPYHLLNVVREHERPTPIGSTFGIVNTCVKFTCQKKHRLTSTTLSFKHSSPGDSEGIHIHKPWTMHGQHIFRRVSFMSREVVEACLSSLLLDQAAGNLWVYCVLAQSGSTIVLAHRWQGQRRVFFSTQTDRKFCLSSVR